MLLDGFNGQEDLIHRHEGDDSSVMSGYSQVNSILPTGGASGKNGNSSRKPSTPSRGDIDTSVSGHSAKVPFPRSIEGKVNDSKDIISKKKRRKKEKKEKSKA
jgi:hypothetical protein